MCSTAFTTKRSNLRMHSMMLVGAFLVLFIVISPLSYLSSKQSSGALRPLPAIWRAPDRRRRVTRITLDVRASGCVGVSGGNYARK